MKIRNIGSLVLSVKDKICLPGETIEVNDTDGRHLCNHNDFEVVTEKQDLKERKTKE